jgi:hypothetical protein
MLGVVGGGTSQKKEHFRSKLSTSVRHEHFDVFAGNIVDIVCNGGKVKLSVCLSKYYAMTTYCA